MGEIASLTVRLTAETSSLTRGLSTATRSMDTFAQRADAIGRRLGSISNGAADLGRILTIGVTAPLAALGSTFVSAAVEMDSLTRGLTAMTGSSTETAAQLVRLQEVAKLPGLGFREAIQGSIRLQAVGINARLAERSLSAFGNAIALTGGGKNELDRVTTQLAQLGARGKVTAEDLRPIIEAAPSVASALKQAFGTIDTQQIQKLHLSSTQFLTQLDAALEHLPHATGGARNAFENLEDASFRLRAAIGGQLLPVIAPLVSKIADMVQSLSEADPAVLGLGVRIAGAAALAGPLLFVLGKIGGAVGALLPALSGVAAFLAGPWGIAIGIAAAGILAVSTNFLGLGDAARAAWESIAETMAAILPPTLALMKRWTNLQVGYLVGLGRAGSVVFQELGSQYSAMLHRLQPLSERLGLRRAGQVIGGAVATSAKDVISLFNGSAPLFHPSGTGNIAAGLAEQFNLGSGSGTRAVEVAAEDFGGRVRQAFMSGFDRDFVGEAGDALTGAMDRLRASLSARGASSGLLDQLRDLLGNAAGAGGSTALKHLSDQVDSLVDKFRQGAKDAGDAWKNMLHSLPTIEVGALPPHVQRLLELGPRGILKQDADNQKGADLTGKTGDKTGGIFGQLAQGASQLLAQFGPLGLALRAMSTVLEPLQPVFDALLVPLRIFGEILAISLVPVLRLLFPIIRDVAIILSVLQEAFDRVIGTLLKGIGWFIRGIGKVINALDPFGNPGNPLVKFGEALRDSAEGFFDAADAIAKKRKELEGLSFDDALDNTAAAANRLSEALINAAEGFRIERFRFAASDAGSLTSAIPRSPPSGPRTDTAASLTMPAPVITIQGATDPDGVARMVVQALNEWARSYPHMRATVAGLTP